MSVTVDQFPEFFHALHGYEPFPWQSRLARLVHDDDWPDCIDLPTASGKTACIDIAVFVLACHAQRDASSRTVGRRIYFTVNRRVIVDEAYDRAKTIAEKLRDADAGILKLVADELRSIGGDTRLPLDIALLRGGTFRDRAWARSIVQPMVICTTADQLGSRLLFRGYGTSDSMKPIHAALTACDSLILLDEAHITRALSQTLKLVQRYRQLHDHTPTLRFVQMTATPHQSNRRFTLDERDRQHPVLASRLQAPKPARLVKLQKKASLVDEVVRIALGEALADGRKAVGIIVNRVNTARKIHAQIAAKFPDHTHLVIGRMRPIDRDALQQQLRTTVGPDRPPILDRTVFVIATQCLEVGADYDFDALVTECASIDALRQRFGRLNRKGRTVSVFAAILTNDDSLNNDDPIYANALLNTWHWLSEKKNDHGCIDFGIDAFQKLWNETNDDQRAEMLSPSSDAAVLLPAHLDLLCQTGPTPEPDPDVSYFIHGPKHDNREVHVAWRADLGENHDLWTDVVSLLPPISPECMPVPLHELRHWMTNNNHRRETPADADVPVIAPEESDQPTDECRLVLIYRGKNHVFVTNNPQDLRPGDTVVLPVRSFAWETLGHIPNAPTNAAFKQHQQSASNHHDPRQTPDELLTQLNAIDIAELAYEQARRLRIIRVHPAIHPELPEPLRTYAASSPEAFMRKSDIRQHLGKLAIGFNSGPDEIDHPAGGLLLRFNTLLPENDPLRQPDLADDDGEDLSIESSTEITLDQHTTHVTENVRHACNQLRLDSFANVLESAAQLHDLGKADIRFNAMLAGLTPFEAMIRPRLLAKSGKRLLSNTEREQARQRAALPKSFRHEMLSTQLAEHLYDGLVTDNSLDRNLLLHLVAAHHGHARPFAPVVIDTANDETRSIVIPELNVNVTPETRRAWIEPHRLDSGIPERFWKLTRTHGWWGLAWIEAILRIADQQASASEQQ